MKTPYKHPQEVRIDDMQCICSYEKFEEIKPINGNAVLATTGICIVVFIIVVLILKTSGQGSKHTMKYLRDRHEKK